MVYKIYNFLKSYLDLWLLHIYFVNKGVIVHPSAIIKGSCVISKGVKIGANTIIDNSNLDGRGKLVIGANCIINRATIITAQHNIDSPEYETTYASVNVDDYVIIYEKSLVLPGRNIGFGSVVAAGAVVTKDVPPMSVVAGNPARVIRKRLNIHTDCDIKSLAGIVFMKKLQELFRRIRYFRSNRQNSL